MKNSTNISFECFKAGQLVTTLTIDPEKDIELAFKLPRAPNHMKLFAHTVVIGETTDMAPPGTLDEVTTRRQFNSLLTRIFKGEYGNKKDAKKRNIVLVTIHEITGDKAGNR